MSCEIDLKHVHMWQESVSSRGREEYISESYFIDFCKVMVNNRNRLITQIKMGRT